MAPTGQMTVPTDFFPAGTPPEILKHGQELFDVLATTSENGRYLGLGLDGARQKLQETTLKAFGILRQKKYTPEMVSPEVVSFLTWEILLLETRMGFPWKNQMREAALRSRDPDDGPKSENYRLWYINTSTTTDSSQTLVPQRTSLPAGSTTQNMLSGIQSLTTAPASVEDMKPRNQHLLSSTAVGSQKRQGSTEGPSRPVKKVKIEEPNIARDEVEQAFRKYQKPRYCTPPSLRAIAWNECFPRWKWETAKTNLIDAFEVPLGDRARAYGLCLKNMDAWRAYLENLQQAYGATAWLREVEAPDAVSVNLVFGYSSAILVNKKSARKIALAWMNALEWMNEGSRGNIHNGSLLISQRYEARCEGEHPLKNRWNNLVRHLVHWQNPTENWDGVSWAVRYSIEAKKVQWAG